LVIVGVGVIVELLKVVDCCDGKIVGAVSLTYKPIVEKLV